MPVLETIGNEIKRLDILLGNIRLPEFAAKVRPPKVMDRATFLEWAAMIARYERKVRDQYRQQQFMIKIQNKLVVPQPLPDHDALCI